MSEDNTFKERYLVKFKQLNSFKISIIILFIIVYAIIGVNITTGKAMSHEVPVGDPRLIIDEQNLLDFESVQIRTFHDLGKGSIISFTLEGDSVFQVDIYRVIEDDILVLGGWINEIYKEKFVYQIVDTNNCSDSYQVMEKGDYRFEISSPSYNETQITREIQVTKQKTTDTFDPFNLNLWILIIFTIISIFGLFTYVELVDKNVGLKKYVNEHETPIILILTNFSLLIIFFIVPINHVALILVLSLIVTAIYYILNYYNEISYNAASTQVETVNKTGEPKRPQFGTTKCKGCGETLQATAIYCEKCGKKREAIIRKSNG